MRRVAPVLALGAALAGGFAVGSLDSFFMDVFVLTCFFAALAVAWNLMAGLTGLLSLGHSLFVGIGAYTVAWGYTQQGWAPFATWPLGIALAVVAALAIGGLCFRSGLKGHFFAIATLAFSEMAFFLVSATTALGRSDGIILPMAPNRELHLQFDEKWPYGLIMGGILFAVFAGSQALLRSRVGFSWRALRDNEEAAEALGVNGFAMKMLCFALSAGIAGLCGAFWASYLAFVDPRSVLGVDLSIQMLVYGIIGGMGALWGPIVGAALLVPLSVVLRGVTAVQGTEIIVYALLLIVLALVLPQGIAGFLTARWRGRRGVVAARARP